MTPDSPAPDVLLADVKWRVDGKPTGDGKACRYVPYIDATTAARLLDEWVGSHNWRDAYEPITLDGKQALYCHLSVRGVFDLQTGHSDWVTKTDVGVASNFEGQKGMVSDAFKRVCSIKWGVARNVYRLPTLWAPCRTDAKGNAWPVDETIPEIIKKLTAAGFADAQASEATADHPDETTTAQPTAAPMAGGGTSPQPTREQFILLFNELEPAHKNLLLVWLKDRGHRPSSIPPLLIPDAEAYIDEITSGVASTEAGSPEGVEGAPPTPSEAPAPTVDGGGGAAPAAAAPSSPTGADALAAAGMVAANTPAAARAALGAVRAKKEGK